jgi:hypothetical protein
MESMRGHRFSVPKAVANPKTANVAQCRVAADPAPLKYARNASKSLRFFFSLMTKFAVSFTAGFSCLTGGALRGGRAIANVFICVKVSPWHSAQRVLNVT